MAAAAGLAITLVPVLMGYFIRGNVLPEHKNPVNRSLVAMYKPLLNLSLKYPKVMIVIALGLMASAYYPTSKLGSEFIP
ncbi:efflux RND transporter permease subunit, partial [Salmonella sp. ZJLS19Sal_0157]